MASEVWPALEQALRAPTGHQSVIGRALRSLHGGVLGLQSFAEQGTEVMGRSWFDTGRRATQPPQAIVKQIFVMTRGLAVQAIVFCGHAQTSGRA
ncbi:hypothetical protein [Ideonella sp.]|uniref:hypothetical protein n=1 Tax=Ideonella sp. TaxID=1929293 RepID=UPI003BB6240B